MMTDEEFDKAEKEANKLFREFKKSLKEKLPDLYHAIRNHEKENREPDVLMVDLFSSKFADKLEKLLILQFNEKEQIDHIRKIARRKGFTIPDYILDNFEWDDKLPCLEKINPEDCKTCDFSSSCRDKVPA